MSEVKRFTGDLMYGKPIESRDGVFVYAADLDRVTAERDAGNKAYNEALVHIRAQEQEMRSAIPEKYKNCFSPIEAVKSHIGDLQQRLTAADERADSFDRLYTSSLDERDQLQQRVDVLERDAARYRWLRDPDNRDDLEPEEILVVGIAEGEDIVWLEQMDQAIDANLEALKPAESSSHD